MARTRIKNFQVTTSDYGPGPCSCADFCKRQCKPSCENYPDKRAIELEMLEEPEKTIEQWEKGE